MDLSLPPVEPDCETCFEGPEEGKKLFRCSTCKNRFYCVSVASIFLPAAIPDIPCVQSVKCQSRDWNSHKYGCSLLPPEGLGPASVKFVDELELEVTRVSDLLKRWSEALRSEVQKEGDTKFSGASLPESSLIAGMSGSRLS